MIRILLYNNAQQFNTYSDSQSNYYFNPWCNIVTTMGSYNVAAAADYMFCSLAAEVVDSLLGYPGFK